MVRVYWLEDDGVGIDRLRDDIHLLDFSVFDGDDLRRYKIDLSDGSIALCGSKQGYKKLRDLING